MAEEELRKCLKCPFITRATYSLPLPFLRCSMEVRDD